MHIVQIASEVAPMAKVGGLADVMMGLNRELKWKGHKSSIIVPKYDCLDTKDITLELVKSGVRSFYQDAWHDNSIWHATVNRDLDVTLLDAHHPHRFFERGTIYGCHDDIERFLYFSRAALDWLAEQETTPDIIHVHDWETAAICFLIRQGPYRQRFEKTRTVLTIHNIAYQGQCSVTDLDRIGLQGAWYDSPTRLLDEYGQCLNLLKGGIIFSDYTTTVSPTYAKEVLTQDGGKGLQLALQENLFKFSGILNGLDYSYWNPEIDPYIYQSYSPADDKLAAKKENTRALRTELKLAQADDKPLLVSISRLVQQKGVELIKHALLSAHKKGVQCLVLGTAPDPAIHFEFVTLMKQYENDPDVRILLAQEERLAHRLYAGAEIFLMPSLFEPCGLTQLIALKYGSIPVVRRTGGLVDTVFDVDFSGKPFAETNGFSFEKPTESDFDGAIDRAIQMWKQNPKGWRQLVQQGMQHDFSWNAACTQYIEVYEKILSRNFHQVAGHV